MQAVLAAGDGRTTVTVSCAFGCPFEGEVDPGAVADLCERFDADELVLADTIGVATPRRVRRLVERVSILGKPVGFHGHNTRNTGYAAAWAALEGGATLLDASVGGLGGCPFSPHATGNVATEDLVWQLERDGVETGVDARRARRDGRAGSRACSAVSSRATSIELAALAVNRLAAETSPYLLQHADNPVDWYPWGDEALARAREEDKPIFLSVGYSACHWCHVMERESFEDPRDGAR